MEENPVIELFDAEGNKISVEVYEVFDFEDQRYALLRPIDEEVPKGEQPNLTVMRLVSDGDQYSIEEIATDEEFLRVATYLNGNVDDAE